MAKQKTVATKNIATGAKKVASENSKKGGSKMNTKTTKKEQQKTAFSKAMTSFTAQYNEYAEFKKDKQLAYTFATTAQTADFIKTLTPEERTALATYILGTKRYIKKFETYLVNQHKLDVAYGKEQTHPSELAQSELDAINEKLNKLSEFIMSKLDDKALTKQHLEDYTSDQEQKGGE